MDYDFCIVGGGIVGLATALSLLNRRPGSSLLLLEKESLLGFHQTGHNSGVIHSGIYYQPGSLKARLCKEGERETKRFCQEYGIPVETCGKLLVATTPAEETALANLIERAKQNGIEAEPIDSAELVRREPRIRGRSGLFIPQTAIVDYKRVSQCMGTEIQKRGGEIKLGETVTAITEGPTAVTVRTASGEWTAKHLVACAGLQSDRIARLAGLPVQHRIVPFRGEYYLLAPHLAGVVKALIYPVPNPALPFLGIHLTRMISGQVTVGPNAILGLAREGYPKSAARLADIASFLSFPGFWKMLWKQRGFAAGELRNSLSKHAYLKECQKYCPELKAEDLLPYPAGIRAQAVMADGTLLHDFLFLQSARMLHVANAPSPAATSAIPIGKMIASKLLGEAES